MLPTLGEMVQFTFGLDVPLNDALNCWVWPPVSEIDGGVTVTDTEGRSVTAADAVLVESAALVAVTMTICCKATCEGAV
jgi:hypothetical protein